MTKVRYGQHTARFTCRAHAFGFAKLMAKSLGYDTEVFDKTGLIGQYTAFAGKPSREFANAA